MENESKPIVNEPVGTTVRAEQSIIDAVMRQTILDRMSGTAGNLSVDNFDPDNIDDQFAKLAMETSDHKVLFDHAKLGPFVINAVYLCLRQAEVTDKKTGEIRSCNRTMIVDDQGTVWGTNSDIAERVTKAILGGVLGKRRFDPPLAIRVAAPSNGDGGNYLSLTIGRDEINRVRDAIKRRTDGVQNPKNIIRDAGRPVDPDRHTQPDGVAPRGGYNAGGNPGDY